MTDRDLLELIAAQVGKLTKDVDEMKATMATKKDLEKIWAAMATKQDLEKIWATMATKQDLEKIWAAMATKQDLERVWATMATKQDLEKIWATMATKGELAEVKAIVIRIENDHGQKLGALFDGYKLMMERLDRLEQVVAKHEEIISRRFG